MRCLANTGNNDCVWGSLHQLKIFLLSIKSNILKSENDLKCLNEYRKNLRPPCMLLQIFLSHRQLWYPFRSFTDAFCCLLLLIAEHSVAIVQISLRLGTAIEKGWSLVSHAFVHITVNAATLREHHAFFLALLQLFAIACGGCLLMVMLRCVDLI